MKDLQTYDTCKYHLDSAREHFASLAKKTLIPPEMVARITADLQSIGDYIIFEEVVIRAGDVKVRRDNNYSQRHSTVLPNFRGEEDLDFGLDIDDYHVRTRRGFQIKVRENNLRRYCERFGLYKDYGANKFADEVKLKLEREPVRRGKKRKPLAEGEVEKTRPRVFKDVENAKKLIEKSLLTLKLVLPLAGVEELHTDYAYDK